MVALIVPLDPEAQEFDTVVAGAFDLRFAPPGLILDVRTLRPTGGAQPDNNALTRQVGKTTAGAILICRFSVVSQKMTATMDWRDLQKGTRASVSEKTARVDLSLSDFILDVLDALLAQVRDRIDEMAAKRREATAAKAAAEIQEPGPIVSTRPALEDDTRVRESSSPRASPRSSPWGRPGPTSVWDTCHRPWALSSFPFPGAGLEWGFHSA